MADNTATAELASEFDDTPSGWAKRWDMEISHSKKALEKFHKQGDQTLDYYLDKRHDQDVTTARLGIFTANIDTLKALLYGKTPQTDVSRRHADSQDDIARVAAEMQQRLLNADIAKDSDSYSTAIMHALEDRLLPGFGLVRVRYEVEMEPVPEVPAIPHPPDPMTGQVPVDPATGQPLELAPAVPATEKKSYECVETDYLPWKDILWGHGKTFHEVPWFAFKAPMTRDMLVKRFGKEVGQAVPLNTKRVRDDSDGKKSDPWDRADVWEIWHKESKRVFWWVDGYNRTLDDKEDPLGLDGFWPFPRPMASHVTTSNYVPKSDFALHQDLYRNADDIYNRLRELVDAVRVSGAYDDAAPDVGRVLTEGGRNKLIPVANWSAFAEKGGFKGVVDWFPLDQVVAAIGELTARLQDAKAVIYEATGMSDIMRGQAAAPATATEQSIKAKFASVRVQSLQDEFARFASDVQKLKAEIISKWFDAETIIEQSNVMNTPDAQMAQQAAQLIKSKFAQFRIEVKPESVSMTDFAALKAEKTEVVGALGQFFQSMVPALQGGLVQPDFCMQLAQWMVAGLKGASTMEGLFDQAIAKQQQAQQQKAMQPPAPPPPDPRMQTEQFKAQAQSQHTQNELQADLIRTKAETQADLVKQQAAHSLGLQAQEHAQQLEARNVVAQLIPGRPA